MQHVRERWTMQSSEADIFLAEMQQSEDIIFVSDY